MNDPELKKMIQKVLFAILIALVFAIPLFFVFKNRLTPKTSELLKSINNKTFLLYITEDNCKICETLKKELDNKNIKYKELNKNKNRDYNEIIIRLDLDNSNLSAPTLIYIKKGEVISYIVDIKDKKYLDDYLENYK